MSKVNNWVSNICEKCEVDAQDLMQDIIYNEDVDEDQVESFQDIFDQLDIEFESQGQLETWLYLHGYLPEDEEEEFEVIEGWDDDDDSDEDDEDDEE
jgi:hypothetical protein